MGSESRSQRTWLVRALSDGGIVRRIGLRVGAAVQVARAAHTDRAGVGTLSPSLPAPWRSGYAAACKAVYSGSNPDGAFGITHHPASR